MRTFVFQVVVEDAEPAADRLQRVVAAIKKLDRPDLVVLPELWLHGGFNYSGWGDGIAIDDPALVLLAETATAMNCHLHVGSVVLESAHGRPTNTTLVYDPTGALVARYDKVHLFGFDSGEAVEFEPGTGTVSMPMEGTRLGLAVCFDLRFPELFRELSDQGSEVLVIPSAWPDKRTEHWRVLLKARAIESQSFVLAAATAGTHCGLTMSGNSAIISPNGDMIAEAGADEDSILFAELDLPPLRELRGSFPVLKWQRLRSPAK